MGRPSAYISRISNKEILAEMGVPSLSTTLLERQLNYFGNIYRKANEHICRKLIFKNSSSQLIDAPVLRRRGRPRAQWGAELRKICLNILGNEMMLEQCLQNKEKWKTEVRKFCRGDLRRDNEN